MPRTIRAPRGAQLNCKGWPQEAAYRMIQNNLDPDVAERPAIGKHTTQSSQVSGLWKMTRRCLSNLASPLLFSEPTSTRRAC